MVIRIFICLLCSMSLQAQYDVLPIFRHLDGEELENAVRLNYTPARVLSLADAKDTIYRAIYLEGDSVRCMYSGRAKFLDITQDPSQYLFGSGSGTDINLEHVYPRSKGADRGNAESDMHILFPSRVDVNQSRGSDPFDNIPDAETEDWYYRDITLHEVPGQDIHLYSEDNNRYFEPREDVKGNVARAVFYFHTIYRDEAMDADPEFFGSMMETLCEWHAADPVDSMEWLRTFRIASYQDNRTNPFVVDCNLARLYCPELADLCTTSADATEESTLFKVYPTVIRTGDRTFIESDIPGFQLFDAKWFDIRGFSINTEVEKTEQGRIEVLAPEKSGVYLLHIVRGHEVMWTQKVIVL